MGRGKGVSGYIIENHHFIRVFGQLSLNRDQEYVEHEVKKYVVKSSN